MALIKHPDKSNFWEKAFILANSVKGQSPVAGMRVAGTCLHVTSAVRKQITMSLGVQLPLLEQFRTQGQGMAPSR